MITQAEESTPFCRAQQNLSSLPDWRTDYPGYMVAKNRERRSDRASRSLCVDCAAPSPSHTRCAECRAIQSIKNQGRAR